METGTCKTCKWWRSFEEKHNEYITGECHRHAPVVINAMLPDDSQGPGGPYGPAWPETAEPDYCGDYEKTKEVK